MSPAEFCELHRACEDVRAWAIATGCATMAELWERDDLRLDWRIWVFSMAARAREARLFACFCARRVAHLNPDPRVIAAIDVAERHARGAADDQELAAARAAALDAASDAAWDAARAATSAAAMDAAWAAASAAASDARAATWATWAARAATWAARAAEEEAQSEYLRGLPNPFAEASHA